MNGLLLYFFLDGTLSDITAFLGTIALWRKMNSFTFIYNIILESRRDGYKSNVFDHA